MKAAIMFLILLCSFVFACCEGKDDLFFLRECDSLRLILTKCGGKEESDSVFDAEHPQYANRPKKILRFENENEDSISKILKENNLYYEVKGNYPADFIWIRKIVIIE